MLEELWNFFMFVTPGLLGFFVSRDTRLNRAAGKRENRYAAYSTRLFFLNIAIFYVLCLIDLLAVNHGPLLDSSWADYRWIQVEHMASMVGVLTAILTLAFDSSSELTLARKLRTWGSALALMLWPLIYLFTSELLSDIPRHLAHR